MIGRSCGDTSGGCGRTSNRCGRNESSNWVSYTRIGGGGGRDARVGVSGIGLLLGRCMDIENGLFLCSWGLNVECCFLLD